jgi:hypothetical protein
MTAYEAAIQGERDTLVRRHREAIEAQENEDHRPQYLEAATAQIIERHS